MHQGSLWVIIPLGEKGRKNKEEEGRMASVIRFGPGGGAAVKESHLSIEQAQSMARTQAAVGKPAGCCWCVGMWDEEEEEVADESPC